MDVLSLEFADLPAREMSGEPAALRCVLDFLRPEWRHREKRRPKMEHQNIPECGGLPSKDKPAKWTEKEPLAW